MYAFLFLYSTTNIKILKPTIIYATFLTPLIRLSIGQQ